MLVTSPDLQPLVTGWLEAYTQSHGPLEFDLQVRSPEAELGADEIRIQSAAPDGQAFVTPLGWEAVTVIVNADVSKRDFSLEELGDIFAGRKTDWSDFDSGSGFIQPVIPAPGDGLRAVFQTRVLQTAPFASTARLAATPQSMADLVGVTSGAIGLLPSSQDPGQARVARVAGQLPDPARLASQGYALAVQIVAVGAHAPGAVIHDFLAWRQTPASAGP